MTTHLLIKLRMLCLHWISLLPFCKPKLEQYIPFIFMLCLFQHQLLKAQYKPSEGLINENTFTGATSALKGALEGGKFPIEPFKFETKVAPDAKDSKPTLPQQIIIQKDPKQATAPQFFSVSTDTMSEAYYYGNRSEMIIPAGSYVKARVIAGAESTSSDIFPLLLELDYMVQAPNNRVINFRNCVMTARAKANLSIERVMAQVEKISCVRNSGEAVERPVIGYISGHDSNFGAVGKYMGHQEKVVLAAILDSLTKTVGSLGQAMAKAQIQQDVASTSVVNANGSANAGILSSVKDKNKYVLGSQIYSTSEAFSRISKFYLDQALALLPTIGITSGQDVWVVLIEPVRLPKLFTDGSNDNTKPY